MVNLQTYKEVFPNWAAISLETTGLKPDWDEILKITVIDHYGRAVLDELYKPCRHQSWSDAEKLNGISFQMVRNKSYIRGKANKISDYDKIREKIEEACDGLCNEECPLLVWGNCMKTLTKKILGEIEAWENEQSVQQ